MKRSGICEPGRDAMPTVIGTIKVMMGQAWIEAADGSRRQAMDGEPGLRGAQAVTELGAVTVTLPSV